MLTIFYYFSVVAVRQKLSNLKQKIEMLMNSTMSSNPTHDETHSFVSAESRSTVAKVVIDKKTEVHNFSKLKVLLYTMWHLFLWLSQLGS